MSVDAVLIAGPTASGKSAASLALAERLGGAIINADSMQVYTELRVLTARPSREDERRAPHLLYGHVSVSERYSAGRYQDDAAHALEQARERNLLPIFVGGTGLYFSVLTDGLSPVPAIPAEVRKAVRHRFETLGRDAFYADLARRDEATVTKLRPSDTQRLLRAADVLEATGRALSTWQEMRGSSPLGTLRVKRFVISPSREILHERIANRVNAMVAAGALDEAAALAALDPSLPAAKVLGVGQFAKHLAGEIGLAEAVERVTVETRQYAKRQLTWFRQRMTDWAWLSDRESSNLITQIAYYLS